MSGASAEIRAFLLRFRRICVTASQKERASLSAKLLVMIRLPVPIDVGTIAATGCSAFAAATPLRVDSLVGLVVHQVLGMRTPRENFDRAVRATLAGMRAGHFFLEINGRRFYRPEGVVVASGTLAVRFFLAERARRRVHA